MEVLQPVALALLVVDLLLWCLLPGGFGKKGLAQVQAEREEGRAARVEEGKMAWVHNLRVKWGIA